MRIITEEKTVGKMSECAEKILHYGGKLMQCLEEMDGDRYGERHRMGYRDEEDDDMMPYSRYGKRNYR